MCGNLNESFPCHPLPFDRYFRVENSLAELRTQELKRIARNNLGLKNIDLYDFIGENIPTNIFSYSFNNNPIAIFLAKLNPEEFGLETPTTFLIIYAGDYTDKNYYIWQKNGTWVGRYSESEAPSSLKEFFSKPDDTTFDVEDETLFITN